MLTPDQAKTRLAEWQLPNDENRIAAGVRDLPKTMREAAKWLLGVKENDDESGGVPYEEYARRERQVLQAAIQFDGASAKDRKKVFDIIGPRLSPALEQAWQLLQTTPFQQGYARKAFRTPRHARPTLSKKAAWISRLVEVCGRYPADLPTTVWLASWAPHLSNGHGSIEREIGFLLAARLDDTSAEANEVFEILRQSLNNQHEIGGMGRHVYTAFLLSNRPHAWELIEKTLLAAQRQEGLRQAILESIDESHPEAFRRMLRLILDHDLIRFSAVVRAVDVWFNHLWAAASAGAVKKVITQVVECLESPAARDKALRGKDAEAAFLALWCAATEDAVASVSLAKKLLAAKSVELRYVATVHLALLNLDVATDTVASALDDEDLRVCTQALPQSHDQIDTGELNGQTADDRFERIERLMDRVPAKPVKLAPLVWPWTEGQIQQSRVAAGLLVTLGERSPVRLIPHLAKLEPRDREQVVNRLVAARPWDDAIRDAVLTLAGDSSASVRGVAMRALDDLDLTLAEGARLADLLTRKTGDLRRGVLRLLLRQPDAAAIASADRLIAAKDSLQRLAGIELLRLMADAGRSTAECRQRAEGYRLGKKKLTREEQSHLEEIFKDKQATASLSDALGLMNPAERTPVTPPRKLKVLFITPAAIACLKSLDGLIHEHRETSIQYQAYDGLREELLGNLHWGFPSVDPEKPANEQLTLLPLAQIWQDWFASRKKSCRDKDGLELVRALAWSKIRDNEWDAQRWTAWKASSPARGKVALTVSGGQDPCELRYSHVVSDLLEWLLYLSPPDASDYLLDVLEAAFALVPDEDMAELSAAEPAASKRMNSYSNADPPDWRDSQAYTIWDQALDSHLRLSGKELTPQQVVRRWKLMHWRDQPHAGARRDRVDSDLLLAAYDQGAANLTDVTDHLLGPRGIKGYGGEGFGLLSDFTDRSQEPLIRTWLARHPKAQELVDRAVARILEIELNRGDAPTAATAPAYSINAIWGIEDLQRILQSLGKGEFNTGQTWHAGAQDDRRGTLTQLAKVTYPTPDESPQDFARIMRAAVAENQFPQQRLLQLAFLAPQWTLCVEAFLGWDQMREGVYWFLAHMRYVWGLDDNAAYAAGLEEGPAAQATADENALTAAATVESNDDGPRPAQKLSAWQRLILERTPMTNAERSDGAIDAAWFRRVHELLGSERWGALAGAARFAANPSQSKRAQFIADVLLGKIGRQELVNGIQDKQLKEHVRLLGLLPLAKGKKRDADLHERCRVLREYRRYANQLSGLTKPAAMLAWNIGMKNLAQSAGYADPQRLEWAVGAEAVKDLAAGPLSVTKSGVTVTLSLDGLARPELAIRKADKPLKSIPGEIKKDKKVADLVGRVTDLRRQATAIRQSLEGCMCRGDAFSGAELRTWCGHALLSPLLCRLVVVGEGILGYPDKRGQALRDWSGKLEPVKPSENLRIAHPHDLLQSGSWQDWQRECFQAERIQPFKQVFRELYLLTKQEKKDGAISHRYDGQQVQDRQALALFGNRGWHTTDGIFKIFYEADLTANVFFESRFGTPAEVEGATLSGVSFTPRDRWRPMQLSAVEPRLFSEVMRDVDLVVSVAHAGGVDPEASASTVEMRAGLVGETCKLLSLKNVRLKPTHAVIDGQLAQYSVHLGSGVVHRMPGGHLCVVPVHAQHRGRLFLPFADDDPRTAEVISKVLLLARDHEIQDPGILEQIRR